MWFKVVNEYIELRVLAKPNAKKSALLGVREDALQIALHAKPQDGAANKELINFLAQLLHIPKTKIILKKGSESRHKLILLPLTAESQRLINEMGTFISVKLK